MQRMEKNVKKKEETSIRVDKETHNLVRNLGRLGETYNDVLKRVLTEYYKIKGIKLSN